MHSFCFCGLIACHQIVQKPEVHHVYRQLKKKSISWNEFGRELGVSVEFRDELRKNISLSNDDRLEKVLCKWSESECSEVSWDRIIKVLKELDYNSMAKDVKDYLLHNPEAVSKYGWKEH